jgi:hypothetical protein
MPVKIMSEPGLSSQMEAGLFYHEEREEHKEKNF